MKRINWNFNRKSQKKSNIHKVLDVYKKSLINIRSNKYCTTNLVHLYKAIVAKVNKRKCLKYIKITIKDALILTFTFTT